MNTLIVHSDEIIGNLIKIPKIRVSQGVGFELPVSVLGGERFWGRIEDDKGGIVTISVIRKLLPLERLDVTLIVGLSRPQTIKKVLAVAVQTGVKKLYFVGTDRGEKSYSSSNLLKKENLDLEITKSLEQTGDSFSPEIKIYHSLRIFLEEAETPADKILFIPEGEQVDCIETPSVLCIGPEAGFSDDELKLMKDFRKVTLSDRVIRVEFAVAMAIGKVKLKK